MVETPNLRTDQPYVESHEEQFITPEDAVVERALGAVYKLEEVLHKSGVPFDQIEATAKLNATNAKREFEAQQNEDPIRRIIGVLEQSAVVDTDKKIVAIRVQQLEKDRSDWQHVFDREHTRLRMQGKPEEFSAEDIVRKTIEDKFGHYEGVCYLNVLGSEHLEPDAVSYNPSYACLNKTLRGLGVLQGNEEAKDLQNSSKFTYAGDFAEKIPTNIPDATARVFLRQNMVQIAVTSKIVEKIVNFPASV